MAQLRLVGFNDPRLGSGGAMLSNFKPTKLQLQNAQAVIDASDAKKKASLKASMKTFAKRFGDSDAKESRGAALDLYVCKYMVYQNEKKDSRKTETTKTVETFSKATEKLTVEMTAHKIRIEFGDEICSLWTADGGLPWEAEPVFGSTKLEHRIYKVPTNLVRELEAKGGEKVSQTETDGIDEEQMAAAFPAFQEAKDIASGAQSNAGKGGGGPPDKVAIKKEKMTDAEAAEFFAQSGYLAAHKRLLGYMAELREMIPLCQANKYTRGELHDDCVKLLAKVNKITKHVDRMVAGEKPEMQAIPGLLKCIDEVIRQVGFCMNSGEETA